MGVASSAHTVPDSADAARTPHYNILAGYNMVRRTLPHTLEDDFTITLGDGPGESLNLNDQSLTSVLQRNDYVEAT